MTCVALKALEKPGAKPMGQTTPAKGDGFMDFMLFGECFNLCFSSFWPERWVP